MSDHYSPWLSAQGHAPYAWSVLGAVAHACADHDVSSQTVRQEGRGADAQLVVVSHAAPDAALSATVDQLRSMDIVREVTSVMRVEGGEE